MPSTILHMQSCGSATIHASMEIVTYWDSCWWRKHFISALVLSNLWLTCFIALSWSACHAVCIARPAKMQVDEKSRCRFCTLLSILLCLKFTFVAVYSSDLICTVLRSVLSNLLWTLQFESGYSHTTDGVEWTRWWESRFFWKWW